MRTQFLLISAAAGALAGPCKPASKESSATFPAATVSAPSGSVPSDTVPNYTAPSVSAPSASAPGYGSGMTSPLTTALATTIPFPSGSVSMPSGGVTFSTDVSGSFTAPSGSIPTYSGSLGGSGGSGGVSMSASMGAGATPSGTAGGNGGAGVSLSMSAGATPTASGTAQTTGGLGMGGGLGGNGGLGCGSGGQGGTCAAPKIAGGLFDILGDLSLNGGMSFSSLSGSDCSAAVFAGAKSKRTVGSLTSAASGILGVGEGILSGSISAAQSASGSVVGGVTAVASGLLSGSGSLLTGLTGGVAADVASTADAGLAAIFAGSNFFQIGGEVAGALGSLCQTAPLCKGKTYTISIEGACGATGDVSMLWQIGGMAGLTSPVTKWTGGMSAKASMSFDFTWDSDDLLTVPLCLLSTIAEEGQTIGLSAFSIAAKV